VLRTNRPDRKNRSLAEKGGLPKESREALKKGRRGENSKREGSARNERPGDEGLLKKPNNRVSDEERKVFF